MRVLALFPVSILNYKFCFCILQLQRAVVNDPATGKLVTAHYRVSRRYSSLTEYPVHV